MHTSLLARLTSKHSRYVVRAVLLATFLASIPGWGQSAKSLKSVAQQAAAPAAKTPVVTPEVPKDPLGRTTPRGTVLGFLVSAGREDYEVAAQYLNIKRSPEEAAVIAKQLFVVLDRRLPSRLNQLSELPEGPPTDPLKPNQYLVGAIRETDVKVFLERVERENSPPIWLFSGATLKAIPGIYEQIEEVASPKTVLPPLLVNTQVVGMPLYEALSILIGLPCIYLLTLLLSRLLGSLAGFLLRRWGTNTDRINPQILPAPVRLLIIAIFLRIAPTYIGFSLIARQFCFAISTIVGITAIAWLLIYFNGLAERYFRDRLEARNLAGVASMQRLIRRAVDLVIVIASVLITLDHFRINITAALAGLGVGGIAIALAAQKTLENVIGGISIILDRAVCVGDMVKVGDDTIGTVSNIGLRSLKLRTLDRSLIVIPNGQVANMSLEILSARDRYWFHPRLALSRDVSPEQLRTIVGAIQSLLVNDNRIDSSSVRVRFSRIGRSSLDVDVFAYAFAADVPKFLEIQEQLLHTIIEIVEKTGARLALPAQTNYLATDPASSHNPAAEALQEILDVRRTSKPDASPKRAAANG